MAMPPLPKGFELMPADGGLPPLPDGFVMVNEGTNVSPRQKMVDSMSPIEKFLFSIGSGVHTTVSGAANLVGLGGGSPLTTLKNDFEKQLVSDVQKDSTAAAVGDFVGTALPGIAAATVAAPLAAAAPVTTAIGLGAAEGAAIAKGNNAGGGEILGSSIIGGATGGILQKYGPKVVDAVTKKVKGMFGKTGYEVVNEAGEMSPEVVAELAKFNITPQQVVDNALFDLNQAGQLPPEELARYAQLRSSGIENPTKAQISRTATDFQEQQELAKTSGYVRDTLEGQQATLTNKFDEQVQNAGERSTDKVPLLRAVQSKAIKLDDEIDKLYKIANKRASDTGITITYPNLEKFIANSFGSDVASDGSIRAIRGKMKELGLLSKKGKPVPQVIDGSPGQDGLSSSVINSEKLRQFMNDLVDTTKPRRHVKNLLLKDAKAALDKDVFSAVGDDIYQQSRAAVTSFENGIETAMASRFSRRNVNIIKDVLEDRIDANDYVNKLMVNRSYRPSDIKTLTNYIKTEAPDAINSFRADTLDYIRNQAFKGPVDGNGYKAITRDGFERIVNRIGKKKLEALMTPEQMAYINNLGDTLKLLEPVRGTAMGQGPSAQAINKAAGNLASMGGRLMELGQSVLGEIILSKQGKMMIRPIDPKAVEPVKFSNRTKEVGRTLAAPVGANVTNPLTERERNR